MTLRHSFLSAAGRLRHAGRAARYAVGVGFALTALASTAALAAGYRWNTTESMPIGLWRVRDAAEIRRGDVVWVCPPNTDTFRQARRYHFVPEGFCPDNFTPLLKPVAAVAGDQVEVTAKGVVVNGRLLANSAPAAIDGLGRRLPQVPRRAFIVQPGTVWLVSSYHPASFDSRYFGPVPAAGIAGVAAPVATLKDRHD